ncbi:hypothetical protein AS361_11550 [Myroides marinus]|uniref:hypothetical protein n=1 Tax=Myroides marinus TaxID=703342 RepID=UPI00074208CA|nr:hypothetical protein [Myroides marinus]KUF43537.1 hypothetical protein AS361_11550 [Myroides marinus]
MKRIITFCLFIACSTINAQSIVFKDPKLKKTLIKLGLDKNNNSQIELSEIEDIKELDISGKKIKYLDDLKHFKNLKVLNANTNKISDINVFNGNQIIEIIYIGDNKLGPQLTLENIPNLKGFYAFRNQIKELKFISPFPNLISLYIQGNPFNELNVQNLINLKNLQLFECDDLKKVTLNKKTKIEQFFILDMKIKKIISLSEDTNTIYLEKKENAYNEQYNENFKIAPTFRTKN